MQEYAQESNDFVVAVFQVYLVGVNAAERAASYLGQVMHELQLANHGRSARLIAQATEALARVRPTQPPTYWGAVGIATRVLQRLVSTRAAL